MLRARTTPPSSPGSTRSASVPHSKPSGSWSWSSHSDITAAGFLRVTGSTAGKLPSASRMADRKSSARGALALFTHSQPSFSDTMASILRARVNALGIRSCVTSSVSCIRSLRCTLRASAVCICNTRLPTSSRITDVGNNFSSRLSRSNQ